MTSGKRATTPPHKGPLTRLVLLGLLLVLAVAGGVSNAQTAPPLTREYQLKAAALYNFAKFIRWPPEVYANGDRALTFCVIGANPIVSTLERISEGKTIQNRKTAIKRAPTMDQVVSCHILFIGRSEQGSLSHILAILDNSSVLTVGETQDFARRGGIIEFFIANNKLRFAINVDAANRARLIISAQLLKLAKIVRTGQEE